VVAAAAAAVVAVLLQAVQQVQLLMEALLQPLNKVAFQQRVQQQL
jgi:hypothetical protein